MRITLGVSDQFIDDLIDIPKRIMEEKYVPIFNEALGVVLLGNGIKCTAQSAYDLIGHIWKQRNATPEAKAADPQYEINKDMLLLGSQILMSGIRKLVPAALFVASICVIRSVKY